MKGVKSLIPQKLYIRLKRAKRCLRCSYLKLIRGGYRLKNNGSNNKVIVGEDSDIRNTLIRFTGSNNVIKIENNVIMRNSEISISGDNNAVTFGSGFDVRHLFMFLVDNDNVAAVGTDNSWGENIEIVVEEGTAVTIGSGCQIAKNVVIRSSDGHSIISDIDDERINHALDIRIADRCWIGENAKILKGASIDADCIVGAGAIVTKGRYSAHALYAGVPVRMVKDNVHWCAERL